MKRWLCAWLLAPALAWASPPVLVVDLSEAYSRSTALAQLLVAVDSELKAIAQRHRPELQRLREELRLLKEQGAASRDRQLAIARRISEIEAAAEADEERLAQANQTAIARVDAAINEVKSALRTEAGARAVLDIQETQYVRPDCPCLATERLYQLLNARLPSVELELPQPKAADTAAMLHRSLLWFAASTHNRLIPA